MLDAKIARDLAIRHGLSQKIADAFVGMIYEIQADAIRECARVAKEWESASAASAAILALLPKEPQGYRTVKIVRKEREPFTYDEEPQG